MYFSYLFLYYCIFIHRSILGTNYTISHHHSTLIHFSTWPTKIHHYGRDWAWIMTIVLLGPHSILQSKGNQVRVVCTTTSITHNRQEYSPSNGNGRLMYQEQSWVPNAPEGAQLVFIPTARVDSCKETTIIEEYKLFFNPCIIALMFMQEPQLCTSWDVQQSVQPNTCNIDQGVRDALVVPTTDLNYDSLNFCVHRYIKLQGLEFQMKHPWSSLNKENGSRTSCKDSYCQPDSKMPHHPSVKLYACGLMDHMTK